MSAPDTNLEKQEKRHSPSLLGIRGAMIFAVLALIVIAMFSGLFSVNDDPAEPVPAAASN